MATNMLNNKQRRFLRLYLGRDDQYHGNGTQCYKVVYECDNDRVSQTSGSRLINHPIIAKEIAAWKNAQSKLTIADAGFVLEQSVRLYDRAMGDAAIEVDVIDTDKDQIWFFYHGPGDGNALTLSTG